MSSLLDAHGSVTCRGQATPMQLSWTRSTDEGGRPSSVLEVEARAGDGELEALWRALFACRVHVTSVQLQVQGDRLVERLVTCEPSGAPLSDEREERVRAAFATRVRAADETTRRPSRVRSGQKSRGKLALDAIWQVDE